MRINKKYITIIEWIIAIVLVVVCLNNSLFSYGSFSPIKAHEQSERTYHYGPSEIVKTIDLDKRKIYLCKYKDWFSANTVKKGVIKWYPGNQVGGVPIDYSKQVSHTWIWEGIDENVMFKKVYGYVSDSEISTIIFEGENKENTLTYELDESRMFIFYWNEEHNENKMKYLRGLDITGKVIYEEKIFDF